jgi:uncharacterized protein (TIGR03435 family)
MFYTILRNSALALVPAACCAQAVPIQPQFSVASLKRVIDYQGFSTGFRETNVSVRCLCSLAAIIGAAFEIKPYQLVGGPSWIGTEYYDLTANIPEGSRRESIPAMLRQLLAERLDLSTRLEVRETAVYSLVVDKNGLKLKPAPTAGPRTNSPDKPPSPATAVNPLTGRIYVEGAMTIDALASFLSPIMDRRVVNKTFVNGEFGILLDARLPEGSSKWPTGARKEEEPREWILPSGKKLPADAPSIFSEVPKMGLRLVPDRASTEYIVIEKVNKEPIAN